MPRIETLIAKTLVVAGLGLLGAMTPAVASEARPSLDPLSGTPDPRFASQVSGSPLVQTAAGFSRFVARGLHRDLAPQARDEFFVDFARKAPENLGPLWRSVSDQLPAEAREIAGPRLEQVALSRVSRLSLEDQLGLLLDEGATEPSAKGARKDRNQAIEALYRDPALHRNLSRIDDLWFRDLAARTARQGLLYGTPEEFVEVKVLIARNLYFAGREVTAANVRAEFERLLELRERYDRVPVFSGREVVFLASPQEIPGSNDLVFADRQVRHALERDAEGLAFYGGGRRHAGAVAPPPGQVLAACDGCERLTFLFSGHGRPQALQYQGGLKVETLARSLVEPLRRAGRNAPGERVIVMILACFGHDFARNLLEALDRIDPTVPKPILVTPEEFGQPWESTIHGGELARALAGGSGRGVTLGRLGREWGLGATVLVPDENNVPRQIF